MNLTVRLFEQHGRTVTGQFIICGDDGLGRGAGFNRSNLARNRETNVTSPFVPRSNELLPPICEFDSDQWIWPSSASKWRRAAMAFRLLAAQSSVSLAMRT